MAQSEPTRSERAAKARVAETAERLRLEAEADAARIARESGGRGDAPPVAPVSLDTFVAEAAGKVRANLLRALDELGNADPKDRVSVLNLTAKLSGMLDRNESGDVAFTFRGWTQPDVVLPPGAVLTCEKCGSVRCGPVETTSAVAPPVAPVESA